MTSNSKKTGTTPLPIKEIRTKAAEEEYTAAMQQHVVYIKELA